MSFFDEYIYLRKSTAREMGFTNHGQIYFVPIWYGVNGNLVAAKMPFIGDFFIDVGNFLNSVGVLGGDGFAILVGDEI